MARITRLRIEGYRSIGDPIEISFPRGRPVVLLGENNTGKSNIVKALQLVLGPFWPGTHEPEDHEFFGRVRNHPIEVVITFDDSDRLGGRYTELKWRYDPGAQEPIHFRGYPAPLGRADGYVSNEDRDTCMCVVVEADRNLDYHLSYSSKWTLLSRMMHRFHRALLSHGEIKTDLEDLFREIKNKFRAIPQFSTFVQELQSQLSEMVGSMTHRLEVDFEAYNPVGFFHALRLQAAEDGHVRTLEEMGTGEQQVLAVALAQAHARAFHSGMILVIEEPEAHLHPLAQDWLARRLKAQSSAGLQLLLTTHSPAFVDVENVEGLVLVSKEARQTRVSQLARDELVRRCVEAGAPSSRVSPDNIVPFYAAGATNEILAGFFARLVVLVEGPTEALALPVYFAKCGLDVSRDGVAVTSVHGKGSLAKWRRLFEAYGIPCYTTFDNDAEEDGDGRKRRDALSPVRIPEGELEVAVGTNDWLVFEEYAVFGSNFEEALRSRFSAYADLEVEARRQGLDSKPLVARWVAERLDRGSGDVGWQKLDEMIQAIRRKLNVGTRGSSNGTSGEVRGAMEPLGTSETAGDGPHGT